MLSQMLKEQKIFKLVCGAGNENTEEVKRLVYVYLKAGCKLFDISPNKDVLNAAKAGAKLANMLSQVQFCVSFGIKGDTHISKAVIVQEKCVQCGKCREICPQAAISGNFTVKKEKCIGCGHCIDVCDKNAVIKTEQDVEITDVLPYMLDNGVNMVELHINGYDEEDLDNKWNYICECNPEIVSICVDRGNFSNLEVISKLKKLISKRKPYSVIIQADGLPMSGSKDNYKTTLQAVAMAEIVQNANLPVYIFISGGTNSKTAELCKLCDITYNGIAVGSWARKIIKEQISKPDFWENQEIQKEAVIVAKKLCKSCKA